MPSYFFLLPLLFDWGFISALAPGSNGTDNITEIGQIWNKKEKSPLQNKMISIENKAVV